MRRKYRLVDAGGRNNNCMILSVIEGAREQFGILNSRDMEEKAREIRKEIADLISKAAGTELGECAFQAMRILQEWKTANPKEFNREVSCPAADHCMHIDDEAAALKCVSEFVPQNRMMGAIELPFLKEIAKSYGVYVIEATRSEEWKDLEDWVDTQIAIAPTNMKVAIIVSDGTHYQSLKPREVEADVENEHEELPSQLPGFSRFKEMNNELRTRKRKMTDQLEIPITKKSMAVKAITQNSVPKKYGALTVIRNIRYVDWAFVALVGAALWVACKSSITRYWSK